MPRVAFSQEQSGKRFATGYFGVNGAVSYRRVVFLTASSVVRTAIVVSIIGIGISIPSYGQSDAVVAVVNGRRITAQEVDDLVFSRLFPLKQQIYSLRKAALESLVTKVLLEEEARKKGVSLHDLSRQITAQPVEVSAAELEKVYQENADAFGSMSVLEAKERLRLDLENQARMQNYRNVIAALKAAAKVEIYLDEPRLPVNASGPSTGPANAAVTIIEFSDFQCPYCRQAQGPLKQLLQTRRGDVKLIFKHLPLDIHARAFASARAAFCAGEQKRFWEYHDLLFASQDLSDESLVKMSAKVGGDVQQFERCFKDELSRTAVLRDMGEAKRLGIASTPTFLINGRLVRGFVGLEEFYRMIGEDLKSRRSAAQLH